MPLRNGISRTLPWKNDTVTPRVINPRTKGGTSTAQCTTVANEVETSNPQGVTNEENPTLSEMA